LKLLSVDEHNKQRIVQCGGMFALAKHLRQESGRLTQNCLLTMRNLSDIAAGLDNAGGILESMTQLLGSSEQVTVSCCAGVLSNMTANNPKNKELLCQWDTVKWLCRTLEVHRRNPDITEPCLCALRHLTTKHDLAEKALITVYSIEKQAGIGLIVELLSSFIPPVTKAALGVIRNLAMYIPRRPELLMVSAPSGQSLIPVIERIIQQCECDIATAEMEHKALPKYNDIPGQTYLKLPECV